MQLTATPMMTARVIGDFSTSAEGDPNWNAAVLVSHLTQALLLCIVLVTRHINHSDSSNSSFSTGAI